MSLGYGVNKSTIDSQAAVAAINLRNSFDQIAIINQWLVNNPVVVGGDNPGDPLVIDTANFGYTDSEAAALRLYFSTFATVQTANATTFQLGSEMTGLA